MQHGSREASPQGFDSTPDQPGKEWFANPTANRKRTFKPKASREWQGAHQKGKACNAGRDGACQEIASGPEVLQDFAPGLKGQQGLGLWLRSFCWRGQRARELVVRQLQTAPQRPSASTRQHASSMVVIMFAPLSPHERKALCSLLAAGPPAVG